MIFALEVFGRNLPNPGFAFVLGLLVIGYFFVNRSDASTGEKVGRGAERECPKCGRQFQPEQMELLGSGDVRRTFDEHCPGCGWETDTTNPA